MPPLITSNNHGNIIQLQSHVTATNKRNILIRHASFIEQRRHAAGQWFRQRSRCSSVDNTPSTTTTATDTTSLSVQITVTTAKPTLKVPLCLGAPAVADNMYNKTSSSNTLIDNNVKKQQHQNVLAAVRQPTKQQHHGKQHTIHSFGSTSIRRAPDAVAVGAPPTHLPQQQQQQQLHQGVVRSRSNGNVPSLPILMAAASGMKAAESVTSVLHAATEQTNLQIIMSHDNDDDDDKHKDAGTPTMLATRQQHHPQSNIQQVINDDDDDDEHIVKQHVTITTADNGDEDDEDEYDELENESEQRKNNNPARSDNARRLAKLATPSVHISLSTNDITEFNNNTPSGTVSDNNTNNNLPPTSPLLQLLRQSSNSHHHKSRSSPKHAHHLHHQSPKSNSQPFFPVSSITLSPASGGGGNFHPQDEATTPKAHRRKTSTRQAFEYSSPHRRAQQQQQQLLQQVFTLGQHHHHHQSLINSSSAPFVGGVAQQLPAGNNNNNKSGMEKYEKLDKIGSGSYGSVYKCRNRETGEQVAIKKFFESEDDPAIRKIAYREIRVLKQLNHDNIVNLMEVFRKKKKLHLVFEYCDTTLLDHMEHVKSELGGVSLYDAKKIMFQVLLALRYIHGHNFIHRDIKPENILLVVPSLTVKLCDFGFARLMNRFNPGEEQFTEYVATRWYRSPELLAGDPYYGPGVDIWAVGCVFPEVVTTQPLFPGQTDTDQLYLIQSCLGEYKSQRIKFKPPNDGGRFPTADRSLDQRLKSTLPAKGVRWIQRALTLDASQRPDAETLLRDSFMEDVYKQFEERWNVQAAARAAQHNNNSRTLTRVGSGGGGGGGGGASVSTERSPSRAEKLPELPTRQQHHHHHQQHHHHHHGVISNSNSQQTLMATSSETLAMAAKLLGTDRLPGITSNNNSNKPVM